MSYSLVLNRVVATESTEMGGHRDVGENVFLAELPRQYQCYAFYYPGAMPDQQLEKALRALGEHTGQNLFVNIGRLNDPAYGKITRLFGIKRTPAIVLTAVAPLAAVEDDGGSVYVRLDSSSLLDSAERTTQCVNEVFTLFIRGDVAKAVAKGKWTQRTELVRIVADAVGSALKSVFGFIADRDLSVSVFEGRFELKRSGD